MNIHDPSSTKLMTSDKQRDQIYYEEKYSSYDSRDGIEKALESLKKAQRESPSPCIPPESHFDQSPSFLREKTEKTPPK